VLRLALRGLSKSEAATVTTQIDHAGDKAVGADTARDQI